MQTKRVACTGVAISVLLFVLSCATFKMGSVWKDSTYQGEIKKVLVIGVTQKASVRDAFEDEFVRQLRLKGIEALSSHTILPFEKMTDRKIIAAKVQETKSDSVFTTRLVERRALEQTGRGKTQYDYYGKSFGYDEPPPYIARGETTVLRTSIFDAKTENLVWYGEMETGKTTIDPELMQQYTRMILEQMTSDRMIR